MSLFIAGTDTGVGKTYVTCALLRACRSAGRPMAPFKPIACGDRADAVALRDAAGGRKWACRWTKSTRCGSKCQLRP